MPIFSMKDKVTICDLINLQDCGCVSVSYVIHELDKLNVVVQDVVNTVSGDWYRIYRIGNEEQMFEAAAAMKGSKDGVRFVGVKK